jgi:hypothetical protein
LTVTMSQNLVDQGARLVHPNKAFVLRTPMPPSRYLGDSWSDHPNGYWSDTTTGSTEIPQTDDPELNDYLLRLHVAAETLFGPVGFDMHCARGYPPEGLAFHCDAEGSDDGATLVRMVTCIHNVSDEDRPLHFARPTWTNHTESFTLVIPSMTILMFGNDLITEYEHGIPPGPDVANYRSVITRFSLWKR